MIRRDTSRRFVAWLAIAALWLLAAAPTLSRVLPGPTAASQQEGCPGHRMGGMDAGMASMRHGPSLPESPGDPALHLDQCGYCALLAHTPLFAGGALLLHLAMPLPVAPPSSAQPLAWRPHILLTARPRGPPSVLAG